MFILFALLQAFVQCHEDVLDRDIQTETIETRDAWNQYPSQVTSIVYGNQITSV